MMFYVVVSLLAAFDLVFWRWADRQLRSLRGARLWRAVLGVLVGAQFAVMMVWVLFPWTLRRMGWGFWIPMSAWIYMWHLLVLPATMLFLFVGWLCQLAGKGISRLAPSSDKTPEPQSVLVAVTANAGFGADSVPLPYEDESEPPARPTATRRQLLGAAAAFVPKAALAGGLVASYRQAGLFRVRSIVVRLPQLPLALDGVTIAHITDTHVGRFVRQSQLDMVVQTTHRLKPDLIAFTGDLIDFNLTDLPMAIDAVRRLSHIAPLAMCVGNHDLFEDGEDFRQQVRSAGLPLLCDQAMKLKLRGRAVEILGLDWGTPESPRAALMEQHMSRLLTQKKAADFSILLAHHPHIFDHAAQAHIPLTLAGHTHGGQLMLTENVGFGNVFRYWSGLYEKGDQKLVVSNGVGNWFPLRINAPAEIVHVRLIRA